MQPPTDPQPEPLLLRLRDEERLLRDALSAAEETHAALRRGDVPAVAALRPTHERLAAAIRAAAESRAAAAAELAGSLGLPPDGMTLSAVAARLPGPLAAEALAARDRLLAVTGDLAMVQRRNANLVFHLRSYFRGVLTVLTAVDDPVRYGPSGARLPPATGPGLRAGG